MPASDNRLAVIAHIVRAGLSRLSAITVDQRDAVESIRAALVELEAIGREKPSDTHDQNRLDFLDAVIADAAGRRICLTDDERIIYVETFGAVDVRAVLDAAMLKQDAEATR